MVTIFYSGHVETEEITVKLLKIIKHTIQEHILQQDNKISLRNAISIVSMALKMAEADCGSITYTKIFLILASL